MCQPTTSQVVVDKNNFTDHFTTVGSATFDKNTGIATLTPDVGSQKGYQQQLVML
jgi:hypothetical protein